MPTGTDERTELSLTELTALARAYRCREADLPVQFTDEPYTRIVLRRTAALEIALVCFSDGQTSSVHDHRGSNCVVRVVRGKVLETLFETADDDCLEPTARHTLAVGDVSGLDGEQVHQLSNLARSGTVLLNFYSPPFQTGDRADHESNESDE